MRAEFTSCGYCSRVAFISFKSFGLCGYYSRAASIRKNTIPTTQPSQQSEWGSRIIRSNPNWSRGPLSTAKRGPPDRFGLPNLARIGPFLATKSGPGEGEGGGNFGTQIGPGNNLGRTDFCVTDHGSLISRRSKNQRECLVHTVGACAKSPW